MSRFFFMQRVLSMLSSGLVFRRVYAGILRAVAILVGVGGAALWVGRWSEVAELRRLGYYYSISGSATLAGVVVQILLIVLLYCWIHTIWLRARTVEELTDTGYVIAPIFSVTLKLVGELMACASVFSGLAGGLSIWIAGRNILHLLGLGSLQLGGLSPHLRVFSVALWRFCPVFCWALWPWLCSIIQLNWWLCWLTLPVTPGSL